MTRHRNGRTLGEIIMSRSRRQLENERREKFLIELQRTATGTNNPGEKV